MKHTILCLTIFLTALGGVTLEAQFHDQGFVNPKARTDFVFTNEGTANNPLSSPAPCLYSNNSDPILLSPGCYRISPTVYSASNHFRQGGHSTNYWVLSANNETHNKATITPWPILTWNPVNSGPPNQSHPIRIPQPLNSMFEFTLLTGSLPGEQLWRAHMIADHTPSASQNPQGIDGIPFLGIGADSRRGNGSLVGRLNTLNGFDTTSSVVRIWDVAKAPGSAALMYNYAIAQWPDANGDMVPRMLFVALYHEGVEHSNSSSPGLHRHWNWLIRESFFHPGGDIAFIDAEDIQRHCPGHPAIGAIQPGPDHQIVIDWSVLYRCMSNANLFDSPMPYSAVDLLGVHWAVEVALPGSLIWGSVHGMRMGTSPASLARTPLQKDSPVIPKDWQDPVTTEQIRTWFWDSCRADPTCWQHNAIRAEAPYQIDYSGFAHTLGVARDLATSSVDLSGRH